MSINDDEAAAVFESAMRAYREEKKRCLKDKSIWKEQLHATSKDGLKCATQIAAPTIVFSALGLGAFGFFLGLMVIGAVAMFSTKLPFRNVFEEYADKAFKQEIDRFKATRSIEVKTFTA